VESRDQNEIQPLGRSVENEGKSGLVCHGVQIALRGRKTLISNNMMSVSVKSNKNSNAKNRKKYTWRQPWSGRVSVVVLPSSALGSQWSG